MSGLSLVQLLEALCLLVRLSSCHLISVTRRG